jgi:hypothetical protein
MLCVCSAAGAFSGTGEAAYYLSNLQGARQVPAGATACAAATVGRMMRQNIAVIVIGESPAVVACQFGRQSANRGLLLFVSACMKQALLVTLLC